MTNEIKNVPELRFPEFKEEWSKLKLGELAEIVRGSSPRPISDPRWFDINSDIGWLRISDVTEQNGKITKLEQKISKDGQKKTRVLHSKHLLLSIAATVGKPVINYVKTGVHDGFLIFLRPLFDIEFMYQWLDAYRPKWKKYGQPGSQVNLNSELVKSQKIYMPHSVEQKKISDFFSKLDQQIELEEQKLEKLEEQKKGYMQKLFSQELRFKDQDGNDYPKWEKKFIKDIFIFENNRRKPITSSLREKGLYPYYGATGIIDYVKDYLFNNEERLLIGEDGAKWGQFEKSSFIANGQYWVNNHAHVVKSNNHNLYFMNYYLNFKELRTFVTGNAPAKLTHANLCNINLEIPCLNEQGKISALLKSIDKKMNNQINKIVLLKRRKQGLLQKMFV